MRFGDVWKFLKHTKAEKVDTYIKKTATNKLVHYWLYAIPAGDIFTKKVFYNIMECPSTGKLHMEGCLEFKTVAEAQAWQMSRPDIAEQLYLPPETFSVTPKEWMSLEPLVSET